MRTRKMTSIRSFWRDADGDFKWVESVPARWQMRAALQRHRRECRRV